MRAVERCCKSCANSFLLKKTANVELWPPRAVSTCLIVRFILERKLILALCPLHVRDDGYQTPRARRLMFSIESDCTALTAMNTYQDLSTTNTSSSISILHSISGRDTGLPLLHALHPMSTSSFRLTKIIVLLV